MKLRMTRVAAVVAVLSALTAAKVCIRQSGTFDEANSACPLPILGETDTGVLSTITSNVLPPGYSFSLGHIGAWYNTGSIDAVLASMSQCQVFTGEEAGTVGVCQPHPLMGDLDLEWDTTTTQRDSGENYMSYGTGGYSGKNHFVVTGTYNGVACSMKLHARGTVCPLSHDSATQAECDQCTQGYVNLDIDSGMDGFHAACVKWFPRADMLVRGAFAALRAASSTSRAATCGAHNRL